MKSAQLLPFLFLLAVLTCVVRSRRLRYMESTWRSWKRVHGKQYLTEKEERLRRTVFFSNFQFVQWHNERYFQGLETYLTEINQFADMTVKEFAQMYLTLEQTGNIQGRIVGNFPTRYGIDSPPSVDWRDKGYVTPVKDQGQCGSCWAFSSTGALEGALMNKTGKLYSLSEQQLVDCSRVYDNYGCSGGLMDRAFNYWEVSGPELEDDYPYNAMDGACQFDAAKVVTKVQDHVGVKKGDEEQLMIAVAEVGPISVAIDASRSGFQFYKEGIYEDPLCSPSYLGHAVLVVGYDEDESGAEYWIVKNSWGTRWGNMGYIWMARNKDNMCGIASMASYPII